MNFATLALLAELSATQQAPVIPSLYVDHNVGNRSPESSTILIPSVTTSFYMQNVDPRKPSIEVPSTCSQITQALKDQYYVWNRPDTDDWIQAQIACNHPLVVDHLEVPDKSFLADDGFTDHQFFIDMHKNIIGVAQEGYSQTKLEGAACSFPSAPPYKYCLGESRTDNETGDEHGILYTVTLQYAGDLNDDGLRDMVILVRGEYIGGRSYWARQIAITRKSPDLTLETLRLPWFFPANGGD